MSAKVRAKGGLGTVKGRQGGGSPSREVAKGMRLTAPRPRKPDTRKGDRHRTPRHGDRHKTRTREEAANLARIREQVGLDITASLDEAREGINWNRRRSAEKTLLAWISTYGIGTFIDDVPDGHLPEVVEAIEMALKTAQPYQVLMPRKHGKTSYVAAAAAWLLVTGQSKFLCVIGANRDAACDIVANIAMLCDNDIFAQDYPEIVVPINRSNYGRRNITYNGKPCGYRRTRGMLLFPTIEYDDGPAPISGAIIKGFGKNSAIRGQRHGTQRPDVVLGDDLQTTESAKNARRVKQDYEKLTRDIANLSGRQKLKVLIAATVIAQNDLAETLRANKAWKTTFFKAFISWPTDYTKNPRNGLWAKYFRLYESEDAREVGNHDESLAFYETNREAMDAGAEVLTPSKFDPDQWEVSTVQAYMNKIHADGMSAFRAELQMEPDIGDFALKITPKEVMAKDGGFAEYEVPSGYLHLFASTDLNLSYALTTTITAYKADGSGAMVYHETFPCSIDGKLTGPAYYRAAMEVLTAYAKRLKGFGLPIYAWGIDCSGTPFEPVTDFARTCQKVHGIKCLAMSGKANSRINLLAKNRIENARAGCILVGDAVRLASSASHIAGREWLNWNSDLYREQVHKALLSPLGSLGSLDLYHTTSRSRDEFAIQVCNEKLLTKVDNSFGRTEYRWESKEPHDYLDSTAQGMALAAFCGVGAQATSAASAPHRKKAARQVQITCL